MRKFLITICVGVAGILAAAGLLISRRPSAARIGLKAGTVAFEIIPALVTEIAYVGRTRSVVLTRAESESPFSIEESDSQGKALARCVSGPTGEGVVAKLMSIREKRELEGDEMKMLLHEGGGKLPLLRKDSATAIDPLEWRIAIGGPKHASVFSLDDALGSDEMMGYELDLPVSLFETLAGGCATLALSR